ncbi:MAG: riboflavin synthase [Muribaculaceae bacterium]|nr:riboflavin synthase [Muribaculaceae bacterium]
MFTGIVEETGLVKRITKSADNAELEIQCWVVLDGTKLGDSIAVNGVCQTVTRLTEDSFVVQISDETLNITNLSELTQGQKVNLERALTLNSRLGGHIVSGHVEGIGKFLTKQQYGNFYNIEIKIPENLSKYVIKKGSVTVNGISLTIADIENDIVKIAVIPHTYQNTNLSDLKPNDNVNIETDILGKYVEKFLSAQDNKKSNIDMNFLQENGFV